MISAKNNAIQMYSLNVLRALKEVIASVYTGGIDRVLSYRMQSDGAIEGMFLENRQVFQYKISPQNKITYVEDQKNRSDAYWEAFERMNLDARSNKRRQCQQGKPCGITCIAKGLKCERGLGSQAGGVVNSIRQSLQQQQERLTNSPEGEKRRIALASGAVGLGLGVAAAMLTQQVGLKMRSAEEDGNILPPITPQENQYYSDRFPSDEDFVKAKYSRLTPVRSNEKQTGSHPLLKAQVKGRSFFLKQASEVAIAKEVAAFEVAEAVGLGDNILPARKIYRQGKPYVVNPLLNKEDVQDVGNDKDLRRRVKDLPKEKIAQMVLFDYAIHNYDRHAGNFLVRKDDSLLLIDHGAVKWDFPNRISTKLETRKNFFFKHGMNSDQETEIPETVLKQFVEQRDRVRQVMAHRYAGMPRKFVDPVMQTLDQRFDVMESMLESGDRRVKHLVRGEPVSYKRKSEVFTKKPQENRVINGIPLQSSDPTHYLKAPENTSFKEPPWAPKAQRKSGVIVVEPDGRLWTYEPKNHYAGTKNTFAKGGVESDLTPQQNAIKEAREELGLKVKIIDHLGDFNHADGQKVRKGVKPSAVIRHYVAIREGGAPWDAHWEADKVKLLTPDDARRAFNKPRDQRILDAVNRYTTSLEGVRKIQGAYEASRKERTRPWRASMQRWEAEKWVGSSAYKKDLYHATSVLAVDPISRNGFNLGVRKVGRAYGNGVYLGLAAKDIEPYRKLAKPEGTILTTKVNVRRVLDIDREVEKVNRDGKKRRPQHVMRQIAINLGQQEDFDRIMNFQRKENVRLRRQLKTGKISQEDYNARYADFLESDAFSYIAQRAGYDAIKVTGGRAKIGMMVVFDPKRVTVVKDEKV